MRKTLIQVGGVIMSTIYHIGSLYADVKDIPVVAKFGWQYHALVGFLFFAGFMTWMLVDKIRQINNIRAGVRITAIPKEIKRYHDSDNNENGIEFNIDTEIWVDRDIHTDNVVLNIVSIVPPDDFWLFIKKLSGFSYFYKRTLGIRPYHGQYRISINQSDVQPYNDTIIFRMSEKDLEKVISWSNSFIMELVLIAGIPNMKYRKFLDKKTWESVNKKLTEPV